MQGTDQISAREGGSLATVLSVEESVGLPYSTEWRCEQWDEDKVQHVVRTLARQGEERIEALISGEGAVATVVIATFVFASNRGTRSVHFFCATRR